MSEFDEFPASIEEYPPLPPADQRSRVPPGQRQVTNFAVLSIDPTPPFDGKNWDVEITGLVENPIKWTWEEFLELPQTTLEADFHCVTGWTRLSNQWRGVLFKDICSIVKPLPEAVAVTSYGNTFYTSSLPLNDYMLDDDVMLAYGHDLDKPGEFLDPEHGGPLRLVVPKIYAYKSTKWLRRLDFTAIWERGYWEKLGYASRASPFLEERYDSDERYARKQKADITRAFRKSRREQ